MTNSSIFFRAQGRAAMLGFISVVTLYVVTGSPIPFVNV